MVILQQHLVVTPDIVQLYSKLNEALLASHQLTNFQRVELILAMGPLGSRKPLELLADMWEVCPSDEHNSKFFAALFLQRLPSHIRVLLTHEDHSNLRLLAAKADQLVAFGGHSNTIAAAVEMSQEDLVLTSQQRTNSRRAANRRGSHRRCRRDPRRRRRSTPPPRLPWPGTQRDCATTIGATATRPTTAPPPAPGRETSWLGCCWRYTPWQAGTHHGQQQ